MSRNPYLTLALGLMCAGGLALLLIDRPPAPSQAARVTTFRNVGDLRRIRRLMPNRPELIVRQFSAVTGPDWRMEAPLKTIANFQAINPILHVLAYLESGARIDPAQADLDPRMFGLESPAAVLELEHKDGSTWTLRLGARERIGDRYFLQVLRGAQDQGIYLVSEFNYNSFTTAWEAFEDPRILPEGFDYDAIEVVEIHVKREVGPVGQKRVEIEKVAIELNPQRQQIRIREPPELKDEPISIDAMGVLLNQLRNLAATEKTDYDPKTPARWGMDPPDLKIVLSFRGGARPLTFQFGRLPEASPSPDKQEEVVYVVCLEAGRVGRIDPKVFLGLPYLLDASGGLRDRRLFPTRDVVRFRFRDLKLDRTLVVERSRETGPRVVGEGLQTTDPAWKVVVPADLKVKGEDLDNWMNKGVLSAELCKVEDFVERTPKFMKNYWGPSEQPTFEVTLTLKERGSSSEVNRTYRFGRPSPRSAYVYVQHDRLAQIYRVPPEFLDLMRRMEMGFAPKEHFSIREKQLDGWIVERERPPELGRVRYACRRGPEDVWLWDPREAPPPPGADATPYPGQADELAGILNELRVVNYITRDPDDRAVFNLSDDTYHQRVTILYRDEAGEPKRRPLRVSKGRGPQYQKVFVMFEDDGIIASVNERLYDLLMSEMIRR
jgi:hypothetical protein